MSRSKKEMIQQQLGANKRNIPKLLQKQVSEFDKDYKIKVLDESTGEVELQLAQKGFEYMPRDILQLIGKQKKRDDNDSEEEEQNELENRMLVSLDI